MGSYIGNAEIWATLGFAQQGHLGPLTAAPTSTYPALGLLVPPALSELAAQQMRDQIAAIRPLVLNSEQGAQHLLVQHRLGLVDAEQIERVCPDVPLMDDLVRRTWQLNCCMLAGADAAAVPLQSIERLIDVRAMARLTLQALQAGLITESLAREVAVPATMIKAACAVIDTITATLSGEYSRWCKSDSASKSLFYRWFCTSPAGTPGITLHTEFQAISFLYLFEGVPRNTASCVRARLALIDRYLRPIGLPDFLVEWTEPMNEEFFGEVEQISAWFTQRGIERPQRAAHFDDACSACDCQMLDDFHHFLEFEERLMHAQQIHKLWRKARQNVPLPKKNPRSEKAKSLIDWCRKVDDIVSPWRVEQESPAKSNGYALLNIMLLPEVESFENDIQMIFESHMNGDEDEGVDLLDGGNFAQSLDTVKRLALGENLIRDLINIDVLEP